MDHAGEGLLREGLKPQEVILKDKETRHCKSSCCIDRGGGGDLEDRASGVSTREEKAGMMVRRGRAFLYSSSTTQCSILPGALREWGRLQGEGPWGSEFCSFRRATQENNTPCTRGH